MKVLLDECAPKQLKDFLIEHGHDCATVQERGWSGIKNGDLLSMADSKFDVLVTIDKGIRHQQSIAGRSIAILIIRGRSSRLIHLTPHFAACAEALRLIQKGQIIEVGQV